MSNFFDMISHFLLHGFAWVAWVLVLGGQNNSLSVQLLNQHHCQMSRNGHGIGHGI